VNSGKCTQLNMRLERRKGVLLMGIKLVPNLWIANNEPHDLSKISKDFYFSCDKLIKIYTKNKVKYFVLEYGSSVRYQITLTEKDLKRRIFVENLISSLSAEYYYKHD
jgi:hypothetical protein